MNQLTLFDKSQPDPLPSEECTMSSRKKVKTVRATSGRHRFVVLAGKRVLHLSKHEYATVGDAKSAGKAKAREIKVLPFYGAGVWPEREDFDGLCRSCLHRGVASESVRLDNAGTPSGFCRDCWEERYPGQLERWGVC